MHSTIRTLLVFSLLGFVPRLVHGWNFTAVGNDSCGTLELTWADGSAPFTTRIHPLKGTTLVYNIPDNAYSSGQGSYSLQLPFAKDQKFLVTMGDKDGMLTGGASDVITTTAPINGNTCNTTLKTPEFFWSGNAAGNVAQCETYPFTQIGVEPGAKIVRPTTLLVLIPNGNQSHTVPMPNATSFAWTVDVAAGSSFIPDMVDAQGNQGGVASLLTVQPSSNSCPLHSTPSEPQKKVSVNAIVGIAIGVVVLLTALSLVLLFLHRRRRRSARAYGGFKTQGSSVDDHDYEKLRSRHGSVIQLDPFHLQPDASSSSSFASTRSTTGYPTKPPASPYSAQPILQHRDITDELEVLPIEVPPGYSENRAPIPIESLQAQNGGRPIVTKGA